MQVRKVVIPVAGWGTRSLPAVKNVPKEMLPIFRKPSIQYIVEEAIDSRLSDVVFVNNQTKRIIEDIKVTPKTVSARVVKISIFLSLSAMEKYI